MHDAISRNWTRCPMRFWWPAAMAQCRRQFRVCCVVAIHPKRRHPSAFCPSVEPTTSPPTSTNTRTTRVWSRCAVLPMPRYQWYAEKPSVKMSCKSSFCQRMKILRNRSQSTPLAVSSGAHTVTLLKNVIATGIWDRCANTRHLCLTHSAIR